MFARKLPAEQAIDELLQRSGLAAQVGKPRKRDDRHFAVFQGHGLGAVVLRFDSVQTEHVARHWKAQHLVAAVFVEKHTLEGARADGVDGAELITGAVQSHSLLHAAQCETCAHVDAKTVEIDFQQRGELRQTQRRGTAGRLRSFLQITWHDLPLHSDIPPIRVDP